MKEIIIMSLITTTLSINAQNSTCSCCTEKHSEFDFWVGSWNVTKPDGTPVGTNIIDKIQDNCILHENWTSAAGNFTGTSSNFYNSNIKQ